MYETWIQVINKSLIPKIIRIKYPELSDEEESEEILNMSC
jgi:hypothetical protein